jgi:pilus assembly protein Flp/PilA
MNSLHALLVEDSGQGMTEYAILLGTLALGAILTLVAIGGRIRTVLTSVGDQVNQIPT